MPPERRMSAPHSSHARRRPPRLTSRHHTFRQPRVHYDPTDEFEEERLSGDAADVEMGDGGRSSGEKGKARKKTRRRRKTIQRTNIEKWEASPIAQFLTSHGVQGASRSNIPRESLAQGVKRRTMQIGKRVTGAGAGLLSGLVAKRSGMDTELLHGRGRSKGQSYHDDGSAAIELEEGFSHEQS